MSLRLSPAGTRRLGESHRIGEIVAAATRDGGWLFVSTKQARPGQTIRSTSLCNRLRPLADVDGFPECQLAAARFGCTSHQSWLIVAVLGVSGEVDQQLITGVFRLLK